MLQVFLFHPAARRRESDLDSRSGARGSAQHPFIARPGGLRADWKCGSRAVSAGRYDYRYSSSTHTHTQAQ